MAASTLTSKGQITVPRAIRERLGLEEGDVLDFVVGDDGAISVRRRGQRAGAGGVLRDLARDRPVTVEEMKRAVRNRARRGSRRMPR
jgi:AbrB family looped-hinge helix DNA binding protein